ncbi:IS4 family transposase [Acidithiobacillus montserratensis]|uniref:IS4 family transposase n=1 Tax=Acidithiobacillus montserratensis TaxID=2729135 RepID=A0ACD5HEA1_9PROT|nr:IS4 family transposase [Acidithiobacillus montserratensis]MBU2749201.1 IS4 family transposase [Acidithiobacillus montserratensis]
MARTKAQLSAGARWADYLTVSYLALRYPIGAIREVLVRQSLESLRRRGLPHDLLMYFVLTKVLYPRDAYTEVLRLVIGGLRPLLRSEDWSPRTVSKGAISQARRRIGVAPFKALYHGQVQPHGPRERPGVFYRGLRIMAMDGSSLEMPDEAANEEYYGHPPASHGGMAFPRLRFVALVESGTHTLCYAKPGPYTLDERRLAFSVMARADASMLVTADRQFYSYPFWKQALTTGAKLLFRLSLVLYLPREEVFSDGSYLSTIYPSPIDRKRQRQGIRVRVIEYALKGVPAAESTKRLITSWLDPEEAPAHELAALYHQRGSITSSFDSFRTLTSCRIGLRSKRPELVEQEFYALLLVHAAIHHLMAEAAGPTNGAVENLPSLHAVRVLHRRLPAVSAAAPSGKID